MTAPFDPYHKWLGISPKDQPPDHYRLLAIDRFESDPDVIESAADKQMGHVRSFQTGKHSDLSQKILNEIAGARVCLLNPEKKGEYDRQLQQKVLPPVTTTSPGGPIPELRVSPPAAMPGATTPSLPVAPPLEANKPPPIKAGSDLPQFDLNSRGVPDREKLSWQVPAAIAATIILLAGIIAFSALSGSGSNEINDNVTRRVPPEESPVGSPSPPTPPAPREPEAGPFQHPTTLPDEQEPVEEPTDTPPVEVPEEPLPPEEAEPPEASETVEEAGQRLREEFSRCETQDDFRRVAEAGLVLYDRAVVEGSIELARELAAFALAAARKGGDSELAKKATLRVLGLQKPLEDVQDGARERLNVAGKVAKRLEPVQDSKESGPRAIMLGKTGEDFARSSVGAPKPDGEPDIHIKVTGLTKPTQSVVVSGQGGKAIWLSHSQDQNLWQVAVVPAKDGLHIYFALDHKLSYFAPFTVVITYSDGTKDKLTVVDGKPTRPR